MIGSKKLDIKALMHPFLKQALYPLLTAKLEGNNIVITQGEILSVKCIQNKHSLR